MSLNRAILSRIGNYNLQRKSRLYDLTTKLVRVEKESRFDIYETDLLDNHVLQPYESSLQKLTENDFKSLLKFSEFKDDIATSLILFFSNEEVRNKYKNLPLSKQFQIGMNSFCCRFKPWSRHERTEAGRIWDILIEAQKPEHTDSCLYPTLIKPEFLPYYEKHLYLHEKHGYPTFTKNLDCILPRNRTLSIWFLDELLSNLYLSIYGNSYGFRNMDFQRILESNKIHHKLHDELKNYPNEILENFRLSKLLYPSFRV